MFLWVCDVVRILKNHTEHFDFCDDFLMISVRIWRSEEVFWRPGSLLREVWGVWGTILAPIGWVGWRNGSGAGNWRANGASNGSLGGGELAPGN